MKKIVLIILVMSIFMASPAIHADGDGELSFWGIPGVPVLVWPGFLGLDGWLGGFDDYIPDWIFD